MKKRISAKVKLLICNVFVTMYCVLAYSNISYAVSKSIYVTGTEKLLKDALSAAQVILALVAVVLWVVWEIQKKISDENEEPGLKKRQKGLIIGTIIGETIMTFFNVVGSYYGVTFK